MANPIWSLSNQKIQNYGTKVDKRLTTVTPSNPQGWETLRTYTDGNTFQYRIDANGNVGYRSGETGDQYANLQQYADDLAGSNSTSAIQNEINGIKNDITGVLQTELKIQSHLNQHQQLQQDKLQLLQHQDQTQE